jgi:hypothetical protein
MFDLGKRFEKVVNNKKKVYMVSRTGDTSVTIKFLNPVRRDVTVIKSTPKEIDDLISVYRHSWPFE